LASKKRWEFWCILGILLLGGALRYVGLEQSPPGLAPDEATNGYDAYSIALTGRDQHGHLLPVVLVSLNDYRMPAFTYVAVPFVGLLGLSVTSVRMAAATCGWLTLPLIYRLGSRMFNWRVGAVAALFLAVSPWHLPYSRIGLEGTVTLLMTTLGVTAVWEWYSAKWCWRWALVAAVSLGLCFYTYGVMKLFTPLLIAGLGVLFWPVLKTHWCQGVMVLTIVGLVTLPLVVITLSVPAAQARYNQIAVFTPDCAFADGLVEFLSNWLVHVSPQYLFVSGDRDPLRHPPGMGQLFWIQIPLLLVALVSVGFTSSRQRAVWVLVLWVILSGIPVALTHLDNGGSGHSLRSIPAAAPWQLLSAVGFDLLWNKLPRRRRVLFTFLIVGIAVQAIPYLVYYFTRYPSDVALRFDDGVRQAVQEMDKWDDLFDFVGFTDQASWPYLHILFFTRYDPHLLQTDLPVRGPELFAPVTRVGKYRIGDVERMYHEREHGLFIMPIWMLPGVEPLAVTYRSNGEPAFKIVVK